MLKKTDMVEDNTPFVSNDPAYLQMMRSLESIPNIDIDPKVDPTAMETVKEGEDNGRHSVVGKADASKPVTKKATRRVDVSGDKTSGNITQIRFSMAGRARLNLARMLYGQTVGRAVSSEEFIMLNIEKGFKKLSPVAYAVWKQTESASEGPVGESD